MDQTEQRAGFPGEQKGADHEEQSDQAQDRVVELPRHGKAGLPDQHGKRQLCPDQAAEETLPPPIPLRMAGAPTLNQEKWGCGLRALTTMPA